MFTALSVYRLDTAFGHHRDPHEWYRARNVRHQPEIVHTGLRKRTDGATKPIASPDHPTRSHREGADVEITGFITALFVGVIIGALGRLVLPGRQKIAIWLTIVIGIVAALLGTFVAGALGVADTRGVDWIELALQVGAAAAGIALFSGTRRRDRHGDRRHT
jgi:uncharacterized membrane protein YeaQ/YmgE (transglycosylase-associated protein family)